MKIDLSEQALESLSAILIKVRKLDPFVGRTRSALVNQIVVDFARIANEGHIQEIAGHLMTPKTRRRALLKRISEMTENADEQSLKMLEKSLVRARVQHPISTEK